MATAKIAVLLRHGRPRIKYVSYLHSYLSAVY